MNKILFLFLMVNVFISTAQAQFRTKKVISDHAILQRGVEIPISGWGAANEKIKVIINKKEYPGTADIDGKWSIKIPPMKAGGPYQIDIKSADNGITYKDIYFGDVWLCSGQSNMEWTLSNTFDADEEISSSNDKLIRQFKVNHLNEVDPVNELPTGSWVVGDTSTLGNFTAVGYYFAKELRKSQNVPIGLLNSSWGGSRIEPWISKGTLDEKHPEYNFDAFTNANKTNPKGDEARIRKMFPGLTGVDAGLVEGKPVWTGAMENGKWKDIDPEKLWEDQGYNRVDGVAWYRTEFEGKADMTLWLGAIDDNDMTWVNGVLVGETSGYNLGRAYKVPASVLKEGKNILLVRAHDTGGGGGLYKTEKKAEIAGKPLSAYDWRVRFGAIAKNNTMSNQVPNLIYNAMIHPVIDFPIKGVIWYQGESNTRNLQEAYDYRYVLRTLIQDWRGKWNQPDLPFFYVSLANFKAASEEPTNDGWAVIRESMTDVLKEANTGQAIIIDIGNADDIHPRNKKDVGFRLALPARHIVYGENVVVGSPMYGDHEVVGNHIAINFKDIGKGLVVKDKYGYVNGFSIAGEDGKFVWAQAKLENNKVVVWNEKVPNPVAVRYAWQTNPSDVNLFSVDGLPVTPFRTDEWEVVE